MLRSALVQHFHYQYNIGDLQWPRNMSNETKRVLRIGTIDRRAQDQLLLALYVQPSPLVDRYGSPIGDGLFSNIGYTRGDLICYFVGEWISSDTAEERQAAGLGGYMIEYTNQEVLDCYSSTRAGRCKASYANSPYQVTNSVNPNEVVRANCEIACDYVNRRIALRCLVASIFPHTELLWKYGVKYRFG